MTIIHPHSTLHVVKTASLNGVFIRFRNSVYEAAGIVKTRRVWWTVQDGVKQPTAYTLKHSWLWRRQLLWRWRQ